MEKFNLINWNDKRAERVKAKIDEIEKNVTTQNEVFKADVAKVQIDNSIVIPSAFFPGDYKV